MKKKITFGEVLVVIVTIVILVTISVIALQASRARARDSKRLADIKQLQSALALYNHDADTYPAVASVTPGAILSFGDRVYLKAIPAPPLPDDGCTGSTQYTYELKTVATDETSYTLNYCLGADTAGVNPGLNTATPAGIK